VCFRSLAFVPISLFHLCGDNTLAVVLLSPLISFETTVLFHVTILAKHVLNWIFGLLWCCINMPGVEVLVTGDW